MKFDIDIVKSVLEKCEKECNGVDYLSISGEIKGDSEFISFSYYCKLLIDEGYIRAVETKRTLDSPLLPTYFYIEHLTWQGKNCLMH